MKFTKVKAIVAAIGALITVLTAAFADDVFDANDVGTVITVLIEQGLTVAAVYGFRNKPVGE